MIPTIQPINLSVLVFSFTVFAYVQGTFTWNGMPDTIRVNPLNRMASRISHPASYIVQFSSAAEVGPTDVSAHTHRRLLISNNDSIALLSTEEIDFKKRKKRNTTNSAFILV